MMLETTIAHGRMGTGSSWPSESNPRRTRRRRESKGVYHRGSPPRSVNAGVGRAWKVENLPVRTGQGNLEFYGNGTGVNANTNLGNGTGYGYSPPLIHQSHHNHEPWQQPAALVSYTLGAHSPPAASYYAGNTVPPPPRNNFYLQTSDNNTNNEAWNNNGPADMPMLDIPVPYGNYGNYEDLGLASPTPTTAGTTSSEGYVFPDVMGASANAGQMFDLDLDLSDEYFQIGQPLDSSFGVPGSNSPQLYEEGYIFENDGLHMPVDMGFGNVYGNQWSATSFTPPKQPSASPVESSMMSSLPWPPEQLQESEFQADANATFESTPYTMHKAKEEYLETGPSSQGSVGTEAVTPLGDSDTESWVVTSTTYTPSHSSPGSQASPRSHVSSPQHHSHVFSSIPGIAKSKSAKGRQRGLTQLEKKQAREVRDAKACWACHISKTKCSPCSPGSPCEQCARLVGKRRFCKFTCFNDPLESLYIFLVPGIDPPCMRRSRKTLTRLEYLNGHLNRTDVEAFVTRNAEGWGTKKMVVKMEWGYRRPMDVLVVPLKVRKNAPELGWQNTSEKLMDAEGKERLVRRQSPPIGVPFSAMDDMQDQYARYIQDIVQSDIRHYIPAAYFPEDSKLMTRLLGVVSDFYEVGLEADEECDLLRRALEMHVSTSIVERTLNLDAESINRVQNELQQRYPKETTSKCAQKQIKFALLLGQQRRINRVLKDWGSLMWTIHNTASNDKKWAISFCVFLILTLTTDKIFGQTWYFCETGIKFRGAEPKSEYAKCIHYLQMTEKELFERCKEIFHWKFKTRKGGKEACNPIRDGMEAFRGRAVPPGIRNLTVGLQSVVREYVDEIRSHCSVKPQYRTGMGASPYMDLGRLTCIFLDDFLDH
ncbi:hypothetical protein LSUE1_G006562 [Lachnellula suecica]|uniref:Uncharacterized protein n=1 Tax=Lachnellula suecica TaxID=602035 RepID=A0A8T9C6H4_9HELO|nr:hypothetical protein LSUE1_G006562 [Lachnellula suecica]